YPSGALTTWSAAMRSRLALMTLPAVATLIALSILQPKRPQDASAGPPGTFSILGFDPETGEIGAAVQSCVFSVGNGVIWAEADVGAVATQAIVDVSHGPRGLALLRQGMAPADIIQKIYADDPDPGLLHHPWPKAGRQFAVIDRKGDVAAFTGPQAPTEA